LGKATPAASGVEQTGSPLAAARQLPWRFAAIAVIYVWLYFTFGYFIAWQDPAVRAYYGGNDPGSFFAQMADIVRNHSGLIVFQIFRGVAGGLIALPIVRMLKGSRWETGLAVALVFSVILSDKLLLPNPYMPEAVRMTHLLETASSDFLFGWAVMWLLTKQRATSTNVAAGSQ
jgi:hypothetical protein